MANLHHHDTLDPEDVEVRYLPQPHRRPNLLVQWAWGLWDMLLRLAEFTIKMVGAAVLVAILVVCIGIWIWHHGVEPGVEKMQDISSTTTTAP